MISLGCIKSEEQNSSGIKFFQRQLNNSIGCTGKGIKEKDWGLWGETSGALSQSCRFWLLLPKENLHQKWLSLLRETHITCIILDTCAFWYSLEEELSIFGRWIIFSHYLFTHEWKFSFLWLINRSFKFKLAVSNHKFFTLRIRKFQFRICIASPSIVKYHQAISCSALEAIKSKWRRLTGYSHLLKQC